MTAGNRNDSSNSYNDCVISQENYRTGTYSEPNSGRSSSPENIKSKYAAAKTTRGSGKEPYLAATKYGSSAATQKARELNKKFSKY